MIKKCLKTEYRIAAELIKNCEKMYKNKDYTKVLTLLEKALCDLEITCDQVLAVIFDFIASALWKLSEYENALKLWRKSLEHDKNNRHAKLCLLFFKNIPQEDYYLELFLKVKLNEYYSINIDDDDIFLTSEKVINNLTKYWLSNMSHNDFSKFSEIQLIEQFNNTSTIKEFIT